MAKDTEPLTNSEAGSEVPKSKSAASSRTVRAGFVITVIGVLGMAQCLPFVYNSPLLSSLVVTAAGILMIVYRCISGQPITPMFQMPNFGRGRQQHDPYADDSWDGWRENPTQRTGWGSGTW